MTKLYFYTRYVMCVKCRFWCWQPKFPICLSIFIFNFLPRSFSINSPLLLSNHNLLSFIMKASYPPHATPTNRTYRKLHTIIIQQFIDTLQSSLSLISSLSCPKDYNYTLKSALDKAAPLILFTSQNRQQHFGTCFKLVSFSGALDMPNVCGENYIQDVSRFPPLQVHVQNL